MKACSYTHFTQVLSITACRWLHKAKSTPPQSFKTKLVLVLRLKSTVIKDRPIADKGSLLVICTMLFKCGCGCSDSLQRSFALYPRFGGDVVNNIKES